jgi:hypothetical protein
MIFSRFLILKHIHSLLEHVDILILLLKYLLASILSLCLISLLDRVAHELIHSLSPFVAEDVICLLQVFLSLSHLGLVLVMGASELVEIKARAHLGKT